jgi:hypothetical protein
MHMSLISYTVAAFLYNNLMLIQPESMQAGDESANKPFEGFYILGIGVVILVMLAVLFVSLKVMKRMNKTEKEE